MKRFFALATVLLLISLLFLACGKDKQAQTPSSASGAQTGIWSLSDRYPSTYTTLVYTATYEINGEPFCLKINRSKRTNVTTRIVKESKEVDGLEYALCESKEKDAGGSPNHTYYECYTGQFRYFVGRDSEGFRVENYLSMDDAIALIAAPTAPKGGITLVDVEWDGYFRLDSCNLEVLVLPDDGGKAIASLGSDYVAQQDGSDTYYLYSGGGEIAYTDGTHSVRIRQANRTGVSGENYLTLDECKAVLALLG